MRGDEPGSFAHTSVVERLPDIARRVLAENDLPAAAVEAIQTLIGEIPHGLIRRLRDQNAPDSQAWEVFLTPALGKDWLEIPWLTAENYFYRRILEATGYFEAGPGWQVDPFKLQKQAGLESSPAAIQKLSELVNPASQAGAWDPEFFVSLLKSDLWANQADLSRWPAGLQNKPEHAGPAHAEASLLVDEAAACAGYLSDLRKPASKPASSLDFIMDNAGFELIVDLALADYLLSSQMAQVVRFHLKAHPVYVSDAMVKDVHQTLEFLSNSPEPATRLLGQRVDGWLREGRLELKDHFFWNSPLPLWDMPAGLHADLASASLVISKGDANYRRVLGDRHWPETTGLDQILAYFPCPLALVRTCKSEIAVGLPEGKPAEISQQDPDWMTDGRWGMIQFWSGKPQAQPERL